MAGLCWGAGPAWADEPLGRVDTPLAQQLEQLAELEKQLTEAQQQLEIATTRSGRRQLKSNIQELQATQDALLDELEVLLLGPQLPAIEIEEEPLSSLEQQLNRQQQHHDAILESDVERRLPAD